MWRRGRSTPLAAEWCWWRRSRLAISRTACTIMAARASCTSRMEWPPSICMRTLVKSVGNVNGDANMLVRSPYFQVEKLRLCEPLQASVSPRSPHIVVAIEGAAMLESAGMAPISFAKGEAVVVPASVLAISGAAAVGRGNHAHVVAQWQCCRNRRQHLDNRVERAFRPAFGLLI